MADEATRALETDLLSPLMRGALIPDLLASLIPSVWIFPDGVRQPFTYATDRARYLERALDRAWQKETGRELEDRLFQSTWPGTQGEIPALMLLTTSVEPGCRIAVNDLAMPRG